MNRFGIFVGISVFQSETKQRIGGFLFIFGFCRLLMFVIEQFNVFLCSIVLEVADMVKLILFSQEYIMNLSTNADFMSR